MTHASSNAANRLIELIERLYVQGGRELPRFGCDRGDLKIFNEHHSIPLADELEEFLCRVLPDSSVETNVLNTFSPAKLLDYQLNHVPSYGNIQHGFFAIGWWHGETDGDGWLYELSSRRIYAVQIYNNYEDSAKDVRDASYHQFESLASWVEFLWLKCHGMGWLKDSADAG